MLVEVKQVKARIENWKIDTNQKKNTHSSHKNCRNVI
jgi:hypothetical protein